MADRYSRSRFMKTEVVDTVSELDMLTNSLDDSIFTRPMSFHTVTDQDTKRPDMISFKIYGQTNFWWIIAKINNIEDLFNDLQEGQILRIPQREDIEDFYLQNRKKNIG